MSCSEDQADAVPRELCDIYFLDDALQREHGVIKSPFKNVLQLSPEHLKICFLPYRPENRYVTGKQTAYNCVVFLTSLFRTRTLSQFVDFCTEDNCDSEDIQPSRRSCNSFMTPSTDAAHFETRFENYVIHGGFEEVILVQNPARISVFKECVKECLKEPIEPTTFHHIVLLQTLGLEAQQLCSPCKEIIPEDVNSFCEPECIFPFQPVECDALSTVEIPLIVDNSLRSVMRPSVSTSFGHALLYILELTRRLLCRLQTYCTHFLST